MAVTPISETLEPNYLAQDKDFGMNLAESTVNLSIPYVDDYYGSTDGIIDPNEYAITYTDPFTGIKAYLEHNGTVLYIGLEARTSGWIGVAWQNYTDGFTNAGLNNSDVVVGYAPGTPHFDYWRVRLTDAVSVHYVLRLRNGTILQEADYPDMDSEEPLESLTALQLYKDAIVGMRIGETRHFIIPAHLAYNDPEHQLYGIDLIYDIELLRIYRSGVQRTANPADQSQIIYSDEYGVSTYQHIPDSDQSRILAASGSDNGTFTQLEYSILLNSTDAEDIPLLNHKDIQYPFVFMYGNTEELNGLPVQHTYWTEPARVTIEPNSPPTLIFENPKADATLEWVVKLQINATDDWVTKAAYRIDDDEWDSLIYNFKTFFWEVSLDLSDYDEGAHVITVNATDFSNATSVKSVNVTIDRPYIPLLGMKLDAKRVFVPVDHYGARVDDTYTIINNGSAPISSIDIYLPEEYEHNFLSISGEDSDQLELHIVQLANTNGMMHWRIHFNDPIGFQEQYEFDTRIWTTSLFWLSNPDEWEYQLDFLKYPVLPYIIRNAEFVLAFEQGGSLTPGEAVPDSTEKYLAPFTLTNFSVSLRLFNKHVVADRNTRITVDAWGWLSYRETVSLDNTGSGVLYTVNFKLPAYSKSVRIYDEVGTLAVSQRLVNTEDFNETTTVTVNLGQDRFGSGLLSGYQYTFTVDYVVQTSAYQSAGPRGNNLEPPMATLSNVLIREHVIDIVMSPSVSLVEATEGYRLTYGIFDMTLRFSVYNRTEENPAAFSVTYQTTLGVLARPVIISLMVGMVGLIYVVLRKVELPEDVTGPRDDDVDIIDSQPRQVGAPPELLKEFANLYSRKTALNIDLEKLDAARRRGKVKKREYLIRERDLKHQIEEIDGQLPRLRDEMISHGSKYREIVGQLELQDERIEGAKAGLRQLLLRKKKQRISRAAFEKSRQEYLKTIQKATSASDRILLSLQEEAGEI
ncbi:MAG: FKBP-type peptidyl-prolyl cis-trans isomerase [Promethearchaeota archaeon]